MPSLCEATYSQTSRIVAILYTLSYNLRVYLTIIISISNSKNNVCFLTDRNCQSMSMRLTKYSPFGSITSKQRCACTERSELPIYLKEIPCDMQATRDNNKLLIRSLVGLSPKLLAHHLRSANMHHWYCPDFSHMGQNSYNSKL